MIAFSHIRKRYGARDVLTGVSLDVRPGTVTGLVGPNGSGKTTLIKILLGLSRADAGAVWCDGSMVDGEGDYRRAIGYMPQIARFPDNLCVRDIIELMRALRPGADVDDELIAAFGLHTEFDKTLGALSGGTRQKVNAVIAFLFRPQIVVLDEPTAGLDPVASRALKDKIARVRDEGRTVLITSHILAELEELADDIAFLCDGSLQFAGSVDALLAQTRETGLEAAIASLLRTRASVRPSRDVEHDVATTANATCALQTAGA
ncbi:MAG TPA: ABC transporter ATP-binding protein [Gemmatimonadaceae bacterium]|nr:ABC transporter ATP-binding protein [Gemmatimonadaceae bacterium]